MRIAIDISAIVYGTGVSVYTKRLVEALIKYDAKNEYLLFGGTFRRGSEIKDFLSNLTTSRVQGKVLPISPTLADFLWNRLHVLPVEYLIGKSNVLHTSDWSEPPSRAFKVTTVHDLAPVLYPEFTDPRIIKAHKARLEWVKKESDRIIVPTNAILEDLVKLKFNINKIRVIYEGLGQGIQKKAKIEVGKIKNKFDLAGNYAVAIGVNKRKNTQRIIEAFKLLKGKVKNLLVIGHKYSEFPETKGVMFTGHVTKDDLAAILTGGEVLIYPSLYEGFGLPILEAFSCELPVVTSNRGSMAEIGGKASVLVDPFDVKSIKEGVTMALRNREKLTKLGTSELSKYSWQNTAKATLEVYQEVS